MLPRKVLYFTQYPENNFTLADPQPIGCKLTNRSEFEIRVSIDTQELLALSPGQSGTVDAEEVTLIAHRPLANPKKEPNSTKRLEKAYARLMKALNDPNQEDCLYEPLIEARDAVNKLLD